MIYDPQHRKRSSGHRERKCSLQAGSRLGSMHEARAILARDSRGFRRSPIDPQKRETQLAG